MNDRRLRLLASLAIIGSALFALPDCGAPDEPLALDTSVDLLDSFSFDTGPMPSSGPVQVSLAIKGGATANVHLPAAASDATGKPALYPATGGTVDVSGGFTLDGTLKVDQSGVPSYDGDIPGLADIHLGFAGSAPVTDFAVETPVTVNAAVTPGDLPPIPLPGGIPGHLQLSIAEGSTVDVTLQGLCAGFDGPTAEYRASAVRSGSLVLAIAVDIDVPIVGTKTFDIGMVTVPLPESTYDVGATRGNVALEDAPDGAHPAPSCKTIEEGSGGAGGGVGTGDTSDATSGATMSSGDGGGPECTDHDDCPIDQGCTPEGTCKDITVMCIDQTMRVDHLTLTKGDREFGGSGPKVFLAMYAVATPDGLEIQVDLSMTETGGDKSTGKASRAFIFPANITATGGSMAWEYTDSNTNTDYLGQDDATLSSVHCMGDTPGEDICDDASCSYCEIELGCFPVLEM